MKILGKILLFLWELPQDLLALILIPILTKKYGKPEKMEYKDTHYLWFKKWRKGVSLGGYVLLGDWAREDLATINHEYGHTRQSAFFGPLYLILIGIPSGLGNLWDDNFHDEGNGWSYEDACKWYYNLPWERWADRLGGVERHYE